MLGAGLAGGIVVSVVLFWLQSFGDIAKGRRNGSC